DDTSLDGFDSLFKVKPPLRTSEDIRALKEAVLDGTIDVVCSDHCPEDVESKDVEFDYAAYGMIGLESFYGVLNTTFDGKLSEERLYEVLVLNPRRILNLEVPIIKEGAPSNFTLYNPGLEWVFDKKAVKSLSANSPFLGTKFKGKVILSGNQGGFSE
ncbi:MAG: amidohydrolase family protein, partial [Bacteroidia bacterium]|nr:amidohydrolase family protein [Bacteroidia bacterium]